MKQLKISRELERGLSLIEVLIALAILAIVALGIVGLFTRSIATNAAGQDMATVAAVTRQAVEAIQAQDFTAVPSNGGAVQTLTDPTGTGAYEVRYTVVDYHVQNWPQIEGTATPPVWPVPTGVQIANLKKVTLNVRSTRPLEGRRELTVTFLKVPSGV